MCSTDQGLDDYVKVKELGVGGFGVVSLVHAKGDPGKYEWLIFQNYISTLY